MQWALPYRGQEAAACSRDDSARLTSSCRESRSSCTTGDTGQQEQSEGSTSPEDHCLISASMKDMASRAAAITKGSSHAGTTCWRRDRSTRQTERASLKTRNDSN